MNKNRYLDVMTVSASHGSTLTKESHQMLFVEPIVLPNMSHLKVDKPTEAAESCLFYPSGEKSVQMKFEIDRAVRNINSEVAVMEAILATENPKTMRESIVVPNRAAFSTKAAAQSTKPAARSTKGSVSSKLLIFPAGDTAGYDPTAKNKDLKKEPLYQSKPTSKEMKNLLKRVRENESKIVSTVKTRI